MRKFKFQIMSDDYDTLGEGEIEIDQKVFDVVKSDEWQNTFHEITDDEYIAAFIARHIVVGENHFGDEEPFFGMDSELVKMIEYPIGWNYFECAAQEMEPTL